MSSNPGNWTTSRTLNSAGRTTHEITHQWTVQKESLRWGRLRSETFGPEADSNLTWYLLINIPQLEGWDKYDPRGNVDDHGDMLFSGDPLDGVDYFRAPNRLDVHVIATGVKDGDHNCQMSLLTSHGEIALVESLSWPLHFKRTNVFEDFITNEAIKERIRQSSFTLRCDLTVMLDSPPKDSPQRSDISSLLSEDLGNLFRSQVLSDLKFIVEDKTLHAHKAILAARSRVFAAMFEHQTAEAHSGIITITDLSADAVEEMLRYVYTGQTPDSYCVTGELMAAADKYDLGELKDVCQETLARTTSVDTAAYLFVLANLHSALSLKKCVLTFIRLHSREIEQTPDWIAAMRDHPRIIAEAARCFRD